MDRIELAAERRTVLGKHVKTLRREGLVPAVIYGRRTEPISIQFAAKELVPALRRAGEASLIAVSLKGETEPRLTLAREIQREVLKQSLLHVDLYEVVMTEKLTTEIPLEFVGIPPALSLGLSMMLEAMNAVEVECLPGDLVSSIQVPVDVLRTFDDVIHVRDIVAPKGITILTDPGEMVVKVMQARAEVVAAEEAAAVPVEGAEIPVIGKGKKEEAPAEEPKK